MPRSFVQAILVLILGVASAVVIIPSMSSSDEEYAPESDYDDDGPKRRPPRPLEPCHFFSPQGAEYVASVFEAMLQNKTSGENEAIRITPMDASMSLPSLPRSAFADDSKFLNLSIDRVYASGLSRMDDLSGILGGGET